MNHNDSSINKLSTSRVVQNHDSISQVQELEEANIITTLIVNKDYQALVAPLTNDEYEKLKDDIQRHGLEEPIKVNSQMVILDGHHRNKACQELGIPPRFEVKRFENQLLEKRYV